MNISIILSSLALIISGLTFWLTHLRKGSIKMTQPTLIFWGNDGYEKRSPKIYLRTLLYSTSKKGQIVENFYVKIRRGESVQNFNIWVYGNEKLFRGSGLFVGQEGVTFNHHFLLPKDGTDFRFLAGEYSLEVYCNIIGSKNSKCLQNIQLKLSEKEAKELDNYKMGIYFDWGPDSRDYSKFIEEKPQQNMDGDLLKLLINK
jgi:hypothetical protein